MGAVFFSFQFGKNQIAASSKTKAAAAAQICGSAMRRPPPTPAPARSYKRIRRALSRDSCSVSGSDIKPSKASRRKSSEAVSICKACSSARVKSPFCHFSSRLRKCWSSCRTEGFKMLLVVGCWFRVVFQIPKSSNPQIPKSSNHSSFIMPVTPAFSRQILRFRRPFWI